MYSSSETFYNLITKDMNYKGNIQKPEWKQNVIQQNSNLPLINDCITWFSSDIVDDVIFNFLHLCDNSEQLAWPNQQGNYELLEDIGGWEMAGWYVAALTDPKNQEDEVTWISQYSLQRKIVDIANGMLKNLDIGTVDSQKNDPLIDMLPREHSEPMEVFAQSLIRNVRDHSIQTIEMYNSNKGPDAVRQAYWNEKKQEPLEEAFDALALDMTYEAIYQILKASETKEFPLGWELEEGNFVAIKDFGFLANKFATEYMTPKYINLAK